MGWSLMGCWSVVVAVIAVLVAALLVWFVFWLQGYWWRHKRLKETGWYDRHQR